MRARTLQAFLLLGFAACRAPSTSGSAERAPLSADSGVPASPEAHAEPDPDPDPDPPEHAEEDAAAAGITLPPLDASCQADADCGILARALEGEQQCCSNPCGYAPHHAGNLAWIAAVEAACDTDPTPRPHCPTAFACPVSLLRSSCVQGQCVLEHDKGAAPLSDAELRSLSEAEVRILEVLEPGQGACGRIHSIGVLLVELLDAGAPAPRLVLYISCPNDTPLNKLIAAGEVLHVELHARRQAWPRSSARLELPEGVVERDVARMRATGQ